MLTNLRDVFLVYTTALVRYTLTSHTSISNFQEQLHMYNIVNCYGTGHASALSRRLGAGR